MPIRTGTPEVLGRTRRGAILVGLGLLALTAVVATTARAEETWDAVFIAGAKVGYVHATVEPFKDRLRVRVDLSLSFKRLDATVTTRMRQGTIETRDGAVESLDIRIQASGQELHTFGDAKDGRMLLTMEGTGRRQQQALAWGPDVRGPYAVEQSLARAPIQAGEKRALKMFLTDVNKVGDITLTARGPEEVPLLDGSRRTLLRVEQTTMLDGKPRPEFDMTLWVDSNGAVLKTSSDSLGGMVTYRTTRKAAMAPSPAGAGRVAPFDQILSSVIKVSPKIARPGATRAVTYRVGLKDDDPTRLIPSDRRQGLKAAGAKNAALLEVRTAGPDDGTPGAAQAEPEYLRPNAMIDSADPRVVALTRTAVGDATGPWEKVVRIEAWVAGNLKDKNFTITFAPAGEVARTLAGDCTEHGVLTAAMCRAAGVPARVVVGLVYVDALGGFGFHLWNEVYVNRRWVAVDATYHQTTVDAVHIKLADSSLDGIAPFETFLPVVRVLGKMSLEPLDVR